MNFLDNIKIRWKVARWEEDFGKINYIFKTNGDNEEALRILNKILKIESDSAITMTVLLYKAMALYFLKRYEESIENCDLVLKSSPDLGQVLLIIKGDALSYLCKHKEASDIYRELLSIEPKNIDALINYSFCLNELEKYQEAVNTLDRILEIEPWNIKAIDNKAVVLNNLNKLGNEINGLDNNNVVVRIIKINVPNTSMWVIGEQGKNKIWDIYLVVPQEKSKQLIRANMTTEVVAIFLNKTFNISFPYEK